MLLALLGGWVLLRSVLWQSPFANPLAAASNVSVVHKAPEGKEAAFAAADAPGAFPPGAPAWQFAPRAPHSPSWAVAPLPPSGEVWLKETPSPNAQAIGNPLPLAPRTAASYQLMQLAAFSRVPLPAGLAMLFEPARREPSAAAFQPPVRSVSQAPADRWSADGWLLLRKDTATAVTSGRGSYGRSQLGAVIRYRLWPGDRFRSAAYLRASRALAGANETEAALGFAARPFPKLPVSLAAEIRVTEVGGKVHERTAAYAVTELPPFALPLGLTGEAYAQGGYLWGDFSTGFVDGQLRAERPIAQLGGAELRAGGGAWGGAQKGAARLDVGPSATLTFKLGEASRSPATARLELDWRFRIAGNAEPSSGPALTISAGF